MRVITAAVLLGLSGACGMAWAATPVVEAPTSSEIGARWSKFLEHAELVDAFGAFDALPAVGYDGNAVDADRCRDKASVLAEAVARIPVSLALRRAAYLCAQAIGDDAGSDRAMAELAALSRFALQESPADGVGRPIRVLTPLDAEALVYSLGMEKAYTYRPMRRPARYFPFVIAARDPASGVERHLSFDYVDAQFRITRKDKYSGFPVQRTLIVNGYVDAEVKDDVAGAIDRKTVNDAEDGSAESRVATLRAGAARGGVESAQAWLGLCEGDTNPHCADGLADALLPLAEKRHALPMVMLSLAYLDGVGIGKDPKAAWSLLDAANRYWPKGRAYEEFARQWFSAHDTKSAIPVELAKRLAQATRDGNRYPERVRILRKLMADGTLTADEVAFLADPAENTTGFGFAALAEYEERRHNPQERLRWLRQAADAGDPASQLQYGSDLMGGNDGVSVDKARGRRMLEQGAQGGSAGAARYRAWLAGSEGNWKEAEWWLLAPAIAADEMALLDLAEIYENERPGVSGKTDQAVTIYRDMASGSAEARRRMARLSLTGKGMRKDPELARKWLLQDAEKGDAVSIGQLANAYAEGLFGKPDLSEALRWLERAPGDNDARTYLGSLLYYRVGTAEARSRALGLWQQSADQADNLARNNLAWALCTSAYDAELDAVRGLALAKAMGDTEALPAGFVDTVAACHAAAGDYERSAALQQQVIDEEARQLAQDKVTDQEQRLKVFRDRLALYRTHTPYREALPAAQSDASKPNSSVSLTSSPTK